MLYVTIVVTSMVDSYGMSEAQAGVLWSWFGFLSIFSGLLFGALSDRIGRRAGMAVAFGVLALSFGLVVFKTWEFSLYLSVMLFGTSAWSVPVIMSASAGDYFGAGGAVGALAGLMLTFSTAQAAGPVIAGTLTEMLREFWLSHTVPAAASLLAVGLVLAIRPSKVTDRFCTKVRAEAAGDAPIRAISNSRAEPVFGAFDVAEKRFLCALLVAGGQGIDHFAMLSV